MFFNHIEPTVFRDTILTTKDWTEFLPKFCQARVEDTGDTHLLNTCGGIPAMARVMTPAEHTIFERVGYAADNDIEVMNVIGLENDSDPEISLRLLSHFVLQPFAKGVKRYNAIFTERSKLAVKPLHKAFVVLMKKLQLFIAQKAVGVVGGLESDRSLHLCSQNSATYGC
ncbi:hypothetical protein B0H14DRAFT_2615828 [Mycena olivaceomarginata]|nr:hypothetical protein B0H14DRAFT_2615828 [Mycena olivaceomarginata]